MLRHLEACLSLRCYSCRPLLGYFVIHALPARSNDRLRPNMSQTEVEAILGPAHGIFSPENSFIGDWWQLREGQIGYVYFRPDRVVEFATTEPSKWHYLVLPCCTGSEASDR